MKRIEPFLEELSLVPLFQAALIGLCLVGIYNFSLAEAALLAVDRTRIYQMAARGDRRAEYVCRLVEHPENFLGVLIVGVNCCVLISSTCATLLAYAYLPGEGYVHLCLLGLVMAFLVVGEIVPKSRAYQDPERMACRQVPFIRGATRILKPPAQVFTVLAKGGLRLLGRTIESGEAIITPDQIRTMVDLGVEQKVLDPDEQDIIERVFELPKTTVREIMTPRPRMVCVPLEASLEEAARLMREEGYSRLPVYAETRDDIRGVVYTKDVLRHRQQGQEASLESIMHPPYIVPETMKIDHLLQELKKRKISLAIVIDEYGGTAGLVTVEDILEEIVGEIKDEFDKEPLRLQVQADGSILAEADVDLKDLEELLGVDLPEGEYDTLSGFILDQIGSVPEVGESLRYRGQDILLDFKVLAMEGPRPTRVKISRPASSWPEDIPPGGVLVPGDGTVIADAGVRLQRIEELLGIEQPTGAPLTVQELFSTEAAPGTVGPGDRLSWQELELRVVQVVEGQVRTVQVARRPAPDSSGGGSPEKEEEASLGSSTETET